MAVKVELTYDMGREIGEHSLELASAGRVADVVDQVRERFPGARFDELARVAAIAVNGVLVNHRRGLKTALRDGDTVAFVKAAAGG